jgi:hypothetical protein
MARWHRVNAKMEALQASVALVQDLVLGDINELSSLVESQAEATEEAENWINTATVNGVRWGTQSTLVAVLSHFPKLEPKLELLGSGWDADLTDNWADALWPLVSTTTDSLASLIPSSLARDPPNNVQ